MTTEGKPIISIGEAARRFYDARTAVGSLLGEMLPEELDGVLSLAEQYGANHARARIAEDPGSFGIEEGRFFEGQEAETLEAVLSACVVASDRAPRHGTARRCATDGLARSGQARRARHPVHRGVSEPIAARRLAPT